MALAASVLLALGVPVWQGPVLAQDAPDNVSVAEATGSGPLDTSIEVQKLEVSEGPGGQEIRRWIPAERLNAGDVWCKIKSQNRASIRVAEKCGMRRDRIVDTGTGRTSRSPRRSACWSATA